MADKKKELFLQTDNGDWEEKGRTKGMLIKAEMIAYIEFIS